MRENMGLYRGKRKRDGNWQEGYLFYDVDSGETEIQFMQYETDDFGVDCWRNGYEVDPETVGQFTGLTDKNGKKIFEGDIVVYDNTPYNAYGHRVVGVIVWHKWMWKLRYKEYESTYHYSVGSEDFFGVKSDVIGNIHDNPELLEVSK